MSRKPRTTISRRKALKTVGAYSVASFLTPMVGASHPLVPLQEGPEEWVPRLFDRHQTETVSTICELIIPQTETPGARGAKVHQYVDFMVSEETPDARNAFLEGLGWIDESSRSRFGARFVDLNPQQQESLLTRLSSDEAVTSEEETGVEFFRDIKNRTIEGYYTSEIGLVQELGYRGKTFLLEFPGCQHEEHKNWEPE